MGSSRITSFESHITDFATASLPLAPGQAGNPLANRPERRHGQAVERLAAVTFHRRLVEHAEVVHPLAAEEHVRHDVEVVREREVLIDDLDPEVGSIARPVDDDVLPVEPDSPSSNG